MCAIFKRELSAYFISPVGYVFMALYLAISGAMLWIFTFMSGTVNTASYFFVMLIFFIILIPILTMKLLSEERKSKTEQILLTSPVSLFEVIFAKYLAAFVLFLLTVLLSCLYFIPLYSYGSPNTAILISNVVGLLFVGGAFIAIGLFISSLTESQFVAIIGTIGAILTFILLGVFSKDIKSDAFRVVIKWLSVLDRFNSFMYGLFDIGAILYYFSIAIIFLFLTIRMYEKRRWQ